uniref:Uncharacterized protein n=1 Tax=Chromera velia CCMP2878 TaxID=1169474 RepID=A0A0G4HQW1_9ALVE|eukprot:Cvel_7999.t1-p1 / transcript=Cvel_7999.t1 / gene=Cvel_7999 / organism=Chromera_velia_CCMP2878 / gene_product=hypothetical protein / transcript_product=hypothetical protein / location=Cvel_scaffold431:19644-23264(-) / protein_length=174 / sequence_SO=supercontig / SO=protein_coding / is_pseudo=false
MSAFWFFFFAAALAPSHGECTRLRRSIPPPSLPPSQCTTAEQLKAPRVLHKRDGYYCQLQDWLEKGKLIGRGTRAQVSAVESKDTSVLPHSQDGKGYALQQGIGERFQKEACFADFADRIGVGPKVFLRVDCFDVFGRNMGSLVMERLYSGLVFSQGVVGEQESREKDERRENA